MSLSGGLMRAAVLDSPNSPLHIEEIPIPQPKAGEVLVKVTACGVCHTDLHVINGEVAFPMPCVLGHEISGTVAATGPGVADILVGQAVVGTFIMPCGTCRFCVRGRDDLCERFFAMNRLKGTLYDGTSRLRRIDGSPLWMYSMGGLAEYAVVPETAVFALPRNLPAIDSAIMGCAVFTAYGAVRNGADLRFGESAAVVGIGGVGLNIVQVARALGASRVIAVDIRDDKLASATKLGATETVNAANENPVDAVRRITGGEGVDVAFEALGRGDTFVQAFEMVRDGGRMVAVGIAPLTSTAAVEITRLVRRSLRIIGQYGARTRDDMPQILRLAAEGRFGPRGIVSRQFPLTEADEAYMTLKRGEIVGRAVIVM